MKNRLRLKTLLQLGRSCARSLRYQPSSGQRQRSDALDVMELEPRILYDAAPIDLTILDGVDATDSGDDISELMFYADHLASSDADQAWSEFDLTDQQREILAKHLGDNPLQDQYHHLTEVQDQTDHLINEYLIDSDETLITALTNLSEPVSLPAPVENPISLRQELVIVDSSVEGYEQLVQDLLEQPGTKRMLSIVIIDQQSDGIAQITSALAQHQQLDAMHLVSHGDQGQIRLGNTTLDLSSIANYQLELSGWKSAFTDQADLLIYGCNIAGSPDGELLLQTIGQLTETDIAASFDITGDAAHGGDWDLEYRQGSLETELSFSEQIQLAWHGTLLNVETSRDGGTAHRAIAGDDNGNVVVVWTSVNADGDGTAVMAQRADFQFNLVGGNFQVNETTAGDQKWASVAADEHGNFVVTWTSVGQDGAPMNVYARRFNADGTDPVTNSGEFLVSSGAGGVYGENSSVAMDQDGNFVIVWEAKNSSNNDFQEIKAQRFYADGSLYGAQILVNSTTSGHQQNPVVDFNDEGEIVIAWSNDSQVFAQRLDFETGKVGSEISVSGSSGGSYSDPSVSLNNTGEFVVSYSTSSGSDIVARRFDSSGIPTGSLINVASGFGIQENSQLILKENGNFIAVWEGSGAGDIWGVFKRAFNANDTAAETESRVNPNPVDFQRFASLLLNHDSTYRVIYSDGNGSDSIESINYGGPTNQAPTGANGTLPFFAGSEHVFAPIDFGYSDFENDPFMSVRITELPANGSLIFNGTAVATNQLINVSDINSGLLTFTNSPGESGTAYATINFEVRDSYRSSLDAYTLQMNAVNTAPTFSSGTSFFVAENQTAVVTLSASDNEMTVQTVTLGIFGGADASQFTFDANTRELYFTGAPNYENPTDSDGDNIYVVDVFADDGQGGLTIQTITVQVNGVNENNPIFTSVSTVQVGENQTTVLTLAATDADLPTQSIGFAITGGADQGKFSIVSGNQLVFQNPPDFEAQASSNGDNFYEVIVTANDGAGRFTDQTVVVEVTPVNEHAPVFTSDADVQLAENGTFVVQLAATDADLPTQSISYTISGGIDQGHFSLDASNNLVFNSAPDFATPTDADGDNIYEVIVTADDGNGKSTDQTITIEVTAVNDNAPVFTSANSVQVAENETAVIDLTATDADLPTQSISFAIIGGTDQNHFTIDGGNRLVFKSAPDFENPSDADGDHFYEVIVTADDGNGASTNQTIMIEVTAVNDNAPVFTSADSVQVAENSTAVLSLSTSDADLPGQSISFAITGGADQSRFTIDPSNNLVFNSAPDFENPADADGDNIYQVTVTADDGNGKSTDQTITIEVTAVNDNAPVFTSANSVQVAENETAVIDLTATDADLPTQSISFAITGGADQNHFTIDGGNRLVFKSAPDFENPSDADGDHFYEVIVTADDGNGTSTNQTITIEVTAVNDNVPVFTSADSVQVAENQTASLSLSATDADLPTQAISFSITGGADQSRFTIDPSNNLILNFSPDFENPADANRDNLYEVVVTANDGNGGTGLQTITFEVTGVNDNAPVFTSASNIQVAENQTSVISLLATDADLPTQFIGYTITGGADQQYFKMIGGNKLTFTAARDFENPLDANGDNVYEVSVTANDGNGKTAVQLIQVTIQNVEEVPVISASPMSIAENAANNDLVGQVNLGNHDNDLHQFSIIAGDPDNIFAIDSQGRIVIANAAKLDFETAQSYQLDVQVMDSLFQVDVTQVNIAIGDVNEAPVASDQRMSVDAAAFNGISLGFLQAIDVDAGDQIHFQWTTIQNAFGLNSATGEVFVVDASLLDFSVSSQQTVTFSVTDLAGESRQAVLTVDIIGNQSPTLGSAEFKVNATERLNVSSQELLSHANDPEGQPLTATLVTGTKHGNLNLRADGSFVYKPSGTYVGTDSFTFVVSDGVKVSQPATVEIQITGAPGGSANNSSSPPDQNPQQNENPETLPAVTSSIGDGHRTQNDDELDFETISNLNTPSEFSQYTAVTIASPNTAASDESVSTVAKEFSFTNLFTNSAVDTNLFVESAYLNRLTSATSVLGGDAVALDYIYFAEDASLWNQLQQMSNEVSLDKTYQKALTTGIAGVSSAVTVGYVLWLVRGGYLMASIVSSLPAWRMVDPLQILDVLDGEDDDESIQSILENASES